MTLPEGLVAGTRLRLTYESKQGDDEKTRTVTVTGVYGDPPGIGFYDVETDSGSKWELYADKVAILNQKFGRRTIGTPVSVEVQADD